MRQLLLDMMLVILVVSQNLLFADPAFDTHFKDRTLRFNHCHTGTASEEHLAFDQYAN